MACGGVTGGGLPDPPAPTVESVASLTPVMLWSTEVEAGLPMYWQFGQEVESTIMSETTTMKATMTTAMEIVRIRRFLFFVFIRARRAIAFHGTGSGGGK